ncbi:MAG: chorismate-binding protein [Propionibacteriaceae bacterium]|jgi:anthranilate synthase component 1|nr:chorismate-binding protein [Propionibacteriaceae bacterium]
MNQSGPSIQPSLAQVHQFAPQFPRVPVWRTLPTAGRDPLTVFQTVAQPDDHCFILDSATNDGGHGRYTFIGRQPRLEISCTDGHLRLWDTTTGALTESLTDDPGAAIDEVLRQHATPTLPGLPPLTGGLVGYFSFDYLRYAEPTIGEVTADEEGFRDVDLMLFDQLIVFDQETDEIYLFTHVTSDASQADFAAAEAQLDQLEQLLDQTPASRPGLRLGPVEQLFDEAQYCQLVEQAQRHIVAGDIFQVVLSNRLTLLAEGSLFDSYRRLRQINPSPYQFYFSSAAVELAGASPETLVRCFNPQTAETMAPHDQTADVNAGSLSASGTGRTGTADQLAFESETSPSDQPSPATTSAHVSSGIANPALGATATKPSNDLANRPLAETFPLAGTRPRGRDSAEDQRLAEELLADPKELAEHNMLVDLGRNDLGKVAEFGSVQVVDYLDLLCYSHVMHIGSTVEARLRPDIQPTDLVSAILPAGTLSGAPKIRACQIIHELEGTKRGVYGGGIGYLSFNQNIDLCIAIRLAFKKDGRVVVRSGAGIVADSVPTNEYHECVNKMAAVVAALRDTSQPLEGEPPAITSDQFDSETSPAASLATDGSPTPGQVLESSSSGRAIEDPALTGAAGNPASARVLETTASCRVAESPAVGSDQQPPGSTISELDNHHLSDQPLDSVAPHPSDQPPTGFLPWPDSGDDQPVLLIDNYDSFSYNLYQLLGELLPSRRIEVIRNDQWSLDRVAANRPSHIVLSPGPGRPDQAGICLETVRRLGPQTPILGVCLGHQVICQALGGTIVSARHLLHGKASAVRLDLASRLFRDLPSTIEAARYHSLAAEVATLPSALRVTATADDGEIMAVEHEHWPVWGIQFHPESILTPNGRTIVSNFLKA